MMKNFGWWNLLPMLLTSLFSGGAAWTIRDIQLNGVSGATEPAIAGGAVIAWLMAFATTVFVSWKKAGGKFDWHVTEDEARAVIHETATALHVPTVGVKLAETFSDEAANAANEVIKSIPKGALSVIDTVTKYFSSGTEDPNHHAVVWNFIDRLNDVIKGDTVGEDLLNQLRDRFDLKLYPGTSSPSTEVNMVKTV